FSSRAIRKCRNRSSINEPLRKIARSTVSIVADRIIARTVKRSAGKRGEVMSAPRQSRRSFITVLSSLAGMSAIQPVGAEAAGQTSAAPAWDLRWVDDLKGQHKQVFDMADSDPASQPPPLRLPRNYLDAFRDVYKVEFPEVRIVIGISGHAFPVNASDRLWEK